MQQDPQQPGLPPLQLPDYWPPNAERASPLPDLDAVIHDAGIDTTLPFLFIGILSSRRTFRRRITVTNTWLQYVTHMPTSLVEARFVLTSDEVRVPTASMLDVGRGLRQRGGRFAPRDWFTHGTGHENTRQLTARCSCSQPFVGLGGDFCA